MPGFLTLPKAAAFGEELLASRFFYDGGGTSIRGFKRDRVGPVNPVSRILSYTQAVRESRRWCSS